MYTAIFAATIRIVVVVFSGLRTTVLRRSSAITQRSFGTSPVPRRVIKFQTSAEFQPYYYSARLSIRKLPYICSKCISDKTAPFSPGFFRPFASHSRRIFAPTNCAIVSIPNPLLLICFNSLQLFCSVITPLLILTALVCVQTWQLNVLIGDESALIRLSFPTIFLRYDIIDIKKLK